MDAIRIVPTSTEAHVAGFHRCVDVVARERRYLGLVVGPPPAASADFVRRVVANGGVHLVALDAGEAVVGWCDIMRFELEGFRHAGRMGMGLLSHVRGRGLGHRLASAALEQARAQGLERVELDVFASNARAAALYRRLGFVEEGVKRRARKLDGTYDDDVLMALLLPGAPDGAAG